jgi:hypothetical protein
MTDIVQKDPKQRLVESIRGWIHMENLVENHTAQAANARTLRAKHEADAIALMKQMQLEKSTIRVSGANLTLQKKTTPGSLTWSYLEKEVPRWATKAGITPVQSQSLIKWLHDHRETKETESLKKSQPNTGKGVQHE